MQAIKRCENRNAAAETTWRISLLHVSHTCSQLLQLGLTCHVFSGTKLPVLARTARKPQKICRSPSNIVLMGQNLKLREQDGVSFSSFPPYPVLKTRKGSVARTWRRALRRHGILLGRASAAQDCGTVWDSCRLECRQVYTCDGCPAHPSTPVADRLSKGYSRCSHFLARDSQGPPSLRSRP